MIICTVNHQPKKMRSISSSPINTPAWFNLHIVYHSVISIGKTRWAIEEII